MKQKKLALLFLGMLFSASLFGADIGSKSFALLRTGYGASATGIGGVDAAWSRDASAMWMNPAALEGTTSGEVMLGYRLWLASMHDEFLTFSFPWKRSTIGVAAFYSLTAVQGWDEENQPTEKMFPQSMVVDLAFSYSLIRNLGLGIGAKVLYENLVELSGTGAVFDAGVWWKPYEWMSVGAALHDIGPGVFYGGSRSSVPWAADAGVELALIPMTTIAVSAGYVGDAGVEGGLGIEVMPHQLISLRAGTRLNSSVSEWGFWSVPTAGLALNWQGFRLDYAIVPYGPLGITHSISVTRVLRQRPPTSDVFVEIIDTRDSMMLVSDVSMSGAIAETLETEGTIRRTWVDPGELKIQAEALHHYQAEYTVALKPGRLNVVTVGLDSIPYAIITGAVTEDVSKSPSGATVYFKGEVSDSCRSDPVWGSYQSSPLPPGEYMVRVIPDDERLQPSVTRVILNPGDTLLRDLSVYRELRANVLMTLYLNFETGKANVLSAHAPILDSIAPILKENADRGLLIEIAGHTDNVPVVHSPFGDNQRLSEARSEAIKNYLVNKHELPEKMFICKGYGEEEPLTTNESPEGRAMNRRIEFRLVAKED